LVAASNIIWKTNLAAPYVHLVFGARQTGKSTLLRKLLPEATVWLDFSRPAKRARHGYVICRCSTPLALTDRVTALPWSLL
jgi:hypothetical protein